MKTTHKKEHYNLILPDVCQCYKNVLLKQVDELDWLEQ